MTEYLPPYPQGVPSGGFSVPSYPYQQSNDPLVSSDYSGWWNRGLAIAGRAWRQLAAIQFVGILLTLALQAPLGVFLALTAEHQRQVIADNGRLTAADFQDLLNGLALSAVPLFLSVVITAIITLAAVHIGVSAAIGGQPRIGAALSFAAGRAFPLLGWQILALPIYLLGVLLCVLPVFYVAAVFIVLAVVVAVERTNAIGRCFTLFNRDVGWSVARIATIIGLSIGAGIVGGLFGIFVNAAVHRSATGTGGIVAGSIASTLLSALITAGLGILLAPLTLAAYADMRSRVEPVSATVIAQQLGILPPPQPSWPVNPQTGQPFTG
jgi:hypothetical protein